MPQHLKLPLVVLLTAACVLIAAASAAAEMPVLKCDRYAALAHRSRGLRTLSSANATKLVSYSIKAHKSCTFLVFLRNHPRIVAKGVPKWWMIKEGGSERRLAVRQARAKQRYYQKLLKQLSGKLDLLVTPKVWERDLQLTQGARWCLASHETPGSSHPYTQQNLQAGDYWGKYQYDPGTWRKALKKASAFYGIFISSASRADQATPQAQETVTAFAVAHPDLMGWHPWAYCY